MPKRRRYRYRSRAEAEDALAESESRTVHLIQALSAVLDDTAIWTEPEYAGGYRYSLGGLRLTGAAGGIVILEETTETGTNRRVERLDDLSREMEDRSAHGLVEAHAISSLCRSMRAERARLHEAARQPGV